MSEYAGRDISHFMRQVIYLNIQESQVMRPFTCLNIQAEI